VCGVEVREKVEVRGSKCTHAQNVKRKQLTINSNNNMTTGLWFYNDLIRDKTGENITLQL